MSRQYRILERPKFESESVFIAQRTRKFLWLFPYWSTYQTYTYSSEVDREFESVEEAAAYIANDAKWEAWYSSRKDKVVVLFQADADGNLTEVV